MPLSSSVKLDVICGKDKNEKLSQLEKILWDAASLIRGSVEASDYKKYILPLIFYKRLSDVFVDEVNRLIEEGIIDEFDEVYELIEAEKEEYGKPTSVRYVIPQEYLWDSIVKLSTNVGEKLTEALRGIARLNPELSGVIDVVDFNETHGGERIISDDILKNVLQVLNKMRMGINDVEPDILGRAYEYMIRKFAEDSGQSAGEFYTPCEVAWLMVNLLDPKPGSEVYDPACGSGGLLIKSQLYVRYTYPEEAEKKPVKLFGQEKIAFTYAIAKMNVILHNMEADIRRGDTIRNPKFLDENGKLRQFDYVVANPMWNQDFPEDVYVNDKFDRFVFGIPPSNSGDWGWIQHMYASAKEKVVVIIDTGAVSRGSGTKGTNRERDIRKKFVENDLIEAVILTPENLFYNTPAAGVIIVINKNKPEERKGKILLINASQEFQKGTPNNYMTEENVAKILDAYTHFKEIESFSKIITIEEARKNDYNLSPSRYIPIINEGEYREIPEIIKDLRRIEIETRNVDKELNRILDDLGFEGYLPGDE
jgi:type I restriction enzyme M protein